VLTEIMPWTIWNKVDQFKMRSIIRQLSHTIHYSTNCVNNVNVATLGLAADVVSASYTPALQC
jgi:hypothetical protein